MTAGSWAPRSARAALAHSPATTWNVPREARREWREDRYDICCNQKNERKTEKKIRKTINNVHL